MITLLATKRVDDRKEQEILGLLFIGQLVEGHHAGVFLLGRVFHGADDPAVSFLGGHPLFVGFLWTAHFPFENLGDSAHR